MSEEQRITDELKELYRQTMSNVQDLSVEELVKRIEMLDDDIAELRRKGGTK